MSRETNCPKTPTSEDFEAAATAIHQFFALGRRANTKSKLKLAALKKLEEEGKRKPSKLRNVRGVIGKLSQEECVSYSEVNQARQTARVFNARSVKSILSQCENAEFLPSVNLFIALTKVPADDRPAWLGRLFENRWTIRQLDRMIIERYGNHSNGGRKPRDPESAGELLKMAKQLTSRYEHLNQFIQQIKAGVVCGPDIGVIVPRSVAQQFDAAVEAMKQAEAALDKAWEQQAA